MAEELMEGEFYTLTDDEGNESQFELIASCEVDGKMYLALVPVTEEMQEEEEYVILRKDVDEDGEEILVTIDDDDEFDRIADLFDDEFADIYYDEDTDQA